MYNTPSPLQGAAQRIIDELEEILLEAERQTKPLELPPFRPKVFELFAHAVATGLVQEDAEPDLSADGVLKALADRWGLADAARVSFNQQSKLTPTQLSKMRLLWGLLRMWMEWTYAWERWPEYHAKRSHDDSQ